jgi:hypothetical protein
MQSDDKLMSGGSDVSIVRPPRTSIWAPRPVSRAGVDRGPLWFCEASRWAARAGHDWLSTREPLAAGDEELVAN